MVGRHDFRYIHTSGGSSHLGDSHATYNFLNFATSGDKPGQNDTKFERHMLARSNPSIDLLHFRMRRGLRVHGTCSWFWETQQVLDWTVASGCQLLYITGYAGTGKTEAALYLLDTIPQKAKPVGSDFDPCIAHFFCSAKDGNALNELEIVRSLLFQLCGRKELAHYVEEAFEQYRFPRGGLLDDFDALWLTLVAMLQDPTAVDVFLIIEAVDTCPEDTRTLLFQHLQFVCSGDMAGRISAKILITCRDISTIPSTLRGIGTHLPLGGAGLRRDLDLYIVSRAGELADSMAYPTSVKEDLIRALRKRNNCTFLWLSVVTRHLQGTGTKAPDLIRRLNELPTDLRGLYDEVLAQISPQKISDVRFILQVLCVAGRELTKDEIVLAYCLHRQAWADDTMPDFRQYEYIILDRTDLVVFDTERETLSFLHDTVVEYLTADLWEGDRERWYLSWLRSLHSRALELLLGEYVAPLLVSHGLARFIFHVDRERANYLCFEIAFKTLGLDELRRNRSPVHPLREYSENFLQVHASASWPILVHDFSSMSVELLRDYHRLGFWLPQAARLDSRCLVAVLDLLDASAEAYKPFNRSRNTTLSMLLKYAAQSGNTSSIEILFSKGANVEPSFSSPLYQAAKGSHVDAVKCLITHGVDVDQEARKGRSILSSMLGETAEAIDGFNVLVQDNATLIIANAYSRFKERDSGPNQAYREVVQRLILASVNLEKVDDKNLTPLLRAAQNRLWPFVERLVELSANVNVSNDSGTTPLLAAMHPPKKNAVYKDVTIQDQGLAFLGGVVIDDDPEVPSDEQKKPIDRWVPAIHALIKEVCDLDYTDALGRSALSLAAEFGEPWVVASLLAAGAKVDSMDAEGFTPLMMACRLPRSWTVLIENLKVCDRAVVYAGGVLLADLAYRSNGRHRDGDGSALRRLETARLLLDSGANPNLEGRSGETALSLAITDNMQDIVELLLAHGGYNASFSLTREATLQRFTYRDTTMHDEARLHAGSAGTPMEVNGAHAFDNSRTHFGNYTSLSISEQTFYARLASVAPLCPATTFKDMSFYGQSRVLLGVEDVSFLNTEDAHNFDGALACPIPVRGINVYDRARWHFAVDILPDWNPLCRPSAADFATLPRCHFKNIEIMGDAKVELGNSAFVEHDGTVFAVTSQYPGNSFRDIRVSDRARLRTSAFTAGSANGVALRIFKLLHKHLMNDSENGT